MHALTLHIYYSRLDRAGNNYYAFTAFDPATNKSVNGTVSGTDNNIRTAELHLRGRWPETGERRWDVSVSDLPIRKYNQLVKGWPYAGCTPEEILAFIRRGLESSPT